MENPELEQIFNDITFMNSIGLFYCLLMLKENLDVPTYSNIIKELKKLCLSKTGRVFEKTLRKKL